MKTTTHILTERILYESVQPPMKRTTHILTERMLYDVWLMEDPDHERDEDDCPDWEDIYMRGRRGRDEMVMWANRAVRQGVFKCDVKNGDTIFWMWDDLYRDTGLMFWSEVEGIVLPCPEISEHYGVPSCFRVGEHGFSPDYWISIHHNCVMVYLSDALVEQLEEQRKQNKNTIFEYLKSHTYYLDIYGIRYIQMGSLRSPARLYLALCCGPRCCYRQEWWKAGACVLGVS
jgi:hypothetical protein